MIVNFITVIVTWQREEFHHWEDKDLVVDEGRFEAKPLVEVVHWASFDVLTMSVG